MHGVGRLERRLVDLFEEGPFSDAQLMSWAGHA